jgi:hypothetical protein
VQAGRRRGETVAWFMNKHAGQIEGLFGSAVFGLRRRLTGFGAARNIVRIRTK